MDCADIDALQDALIAGSTDLAYDMDSDGNVHCDDLFFHIRNYVELQDGSGRVGTEPGDFNLDGFVNATDLAIMKPNFGLPDKGYCDGNLNCDIWLNGTDLAIMAGNIGYVAPTGSAIPEPATMGLLVLGGSATLRRRKRRGWIRS